MKAKNVNEKALTFDYINNRMSLPDICKKYKIDMDKPIEKLKRN
mgnify:CR=1 FL=1